MIIDAQNELKNTSLKSLVTFSNKRFHTNIVSKMYFDFEKTISNDTQRAEYVKLVAEFIKQNNFHGVIMEWIDFLPGLIDIDIGFYIQTLKVGYFAGFD
jgi:hypothetical protein